MILNLQSSHLEIMRAHAERTYPHECCGLLLGRTVDEVKELVEVWATENAWHEDAPETREFDRDIERTLSSERRYTIAPEEMLAAQRHARDLHLDIIGIYHSHPNCPAIPSECDRVLAWSQYSYIIVAVEGGKAVNVRSWQLDDTEQFQPEEIRLGDRVM